MIDNRNIDKVIKILRRWLKEKAYVSKLEKDPFKVLVATILSARTKDEITAKASNKLFTRVKSVKDLAKLKVKEIEELIYPVGFYRNKAKALKKLADTLIKNYHGKVPDSMGELLELPGVGRKTANLVLSLGFGQQAICVDTHVHRVMNRWGYVKTTKPVETEMVLRKKLPKKYWKEINGLLVAFGRQICKPISPLCSQCPLTKYCPKKGVKRHR